jgi:hypothetical protein
VSTALPIVQRLLADRPPIAAPESPSPSSWTVLFQRLTGIDLTRCPRCEQSTLERRVLSPYAGRPPP